MSLPSSPNNRREVYLSNIAGQGTTLPTEPHTREEEYLDYIARNGGGGGGTGEGDMKKAVYDDDLAVAGAGGIKAYVASAISGKVDKVNGKGLSTNDYDDSAKSIVDGVTTALDGKVSKSNVAGLLKNDGTVDTTSYATAASVTAIKDGQSIDSFGDVESALADKVSKSATVGLLKNDGTIDTNTYLQSVPFGTTSVVGGFTYESDDFYITIPSSNTIGLIKGTITPNAINPPSAGDVYDTIQDVYEVNSILGAKNLNRTAYASGTVNDITFTVNDDGTVTANGVASADTQNGELNAQTFVAPFDAQVILSGGLASSAYIFPYDITAQARPYTNSAKTARLTTDDNATNTNDVSFWMEKGHSLRMTIRILNGAHLASTATFKPLLRLASDTDSTYQPYAMTNKELTDEKFPRSEQAVLGAKNLLPKFSGSYEHKNVTYTADANGVVTCSGTTGVDTSYWRQSILLKKGTYKISGGDGIATKPGNDVFVGLMGPSAYLNPDAGTDDVYTFSSDMTVGFTLRIGGGINSSLYTFYPMIRLASDSDNTYQPYAMTNKELTETKDAWSPTSTVSNGAISFSGIDDTNNNGYKLYIDVSSSSTELNPTGEITSISGTGTSNMSITFSTNADSGASGKLRILK